MSCRSSLSFTGHHGFSRQPRHQVTSRMTAPATSSIGATQPKIHPRAAQRNYAVRRTRTPPVTASIDSANRATDELSTSASTGRAAKVGLRAGLARGRGQVLGSEVWTTEVPVDEQVLVGLGSYSS